MLADLACEKARGTNAKILIGGLGLGFSLKRVLQCVGLNAQVHVAELIPEVVAWNREFLRDLNGALLEDARVEVFIEDVYQIIRRSAANCHYDAIILDVDNGPNAMVQKQNTRLYDRHGFNRISKALSSSPPGRVTFWSAVEDRPFAHRLAQSGFKVEAHAAKSHERAKRAAHTIYVGEKLSPQVGGDDAPLPVAATRRADRR